MTEYISKEKTLEMLDKACREYGEDCSMGFSLAASIINRLPASDVVEVVRCKDCKYWEAEVCYVNERLIDSGATFYCAYGKRKEGEE